MTAWGRDLPDSTGPGLSALNGRIGDANRSTRGQKRALPHVRTVATKQPFGACSNVGTVFGATEDSMIQPLNNVGRNFASSAIVTGALLLLNVGGCTKPAQENGAPTRQSNAPSTAALAKLYEPSSLTEVREVQQFPADLKAALSDNGLDISKSKTRPAQFLVGGLSATAAIIEYEQFTTCPLITQQYMFLQGGAGIGFGTGPLLRLSTSRNYLRLRGLCLLDRFPVADRRWCRLRVVTSR